MSSLFTPAHLHLALNHVPIIGLTVASLPVLIGIIFHSRGALASGLLAVICCAGAMPVIMETGEAARDGFFDGAVQPDLDKPGYDALRQHAGRAKATAPVVYAAGILALVALLALTKFPRQAAWIGWAVLVGNLLSVSLSVWTAEAGGRIRHAEFRPVPPATPSPTPLPIPQATAQPAPTQPVEAPAPSAPETPATNPAGL
jgi:hypothetical protein